MKKFITYAALAIAVGLSPPFFYEVYVEHSAMAAVREINEDHLSKSQAVQDEAPPIRGPEEARRWKQRLESLGMWPEPTVLRLIKPENGWCCNREDANDAAAYSVWYKELKKRAAGELMKRKNKIQERVNESQ